MNHINSLLNKINCSGCTACLHSCPVQCINMQLDEEGFLYPLVNESICIDCGLCIKVCPFLVPKYKVSESIKKTPLSFAVKHKIDYIRLESTSGGIFTAFSDYVLENNGIIFGAVFDNTSLSVKHVFAKNKKQRDRMRGSKYVQSDLGDSFIIVKRFLEKGIQVLFTGTPCQTAGLISFLKKDYENLLVIDVLCFNVPSPLILNEILVDKCKEDIIDIKFRNKDNGWRNSNMLKLIFKNNIVEYNSVFLNLFYKRLISRPVCYNCRFTNMKRPSDITIGDFWGINKVNPEFEDNLGVSCLLINSDKGDVYFSKIKDKLNYIETPLNSVIQPCLVEPTKLPIKRLSFWDDYFNNGFSYVVEKYGQNTMFDNFKINILVPLSRKLGISFLKHIFISIIKRLS